MKILSALLCAGAMLLGSVSFVSAADKTPCCKATVKAGKKCKNECCVKAAEGGKVCEKCHPKEEKK